MKDLWLVGLLLLLGGNPGMDAVFNEKYAYIATAVVLAMLLHRRGVSPLGQRLPWIGGAFLSILLTQTLDFGIPYVTLLGFATRLFIASAVVRLVRDFPVTYVRAIYLLAIYSIVVWSIDQLCLALGIGLREWFEPLAEAIGAPGEHQFVLFYTFAGQVHRNAAFFREPGLFAGYLLLGLLLLSLRNNAFARKDAKRTQLVLLLALATTMSTAGYITAPLVLAASALRERQRLTSTATAVKRFTVILFVGVGIVWFASNHSDFIAEKIAQEYEFFDLESAGFEVSRLGAALFDFQAIVERPVFGWGIDTGTKFALTPEFIELGITPSGGVTGWARSFGIVGLLILIAALWTSVRPLSGHGPITTSYVTFVLLVIAQPNAFLNYPLFLSLMFLPETGGSSLVRDDEVATVQPEQRHTSADVSGGFAAAAQLDTREAVHA